MSSMGNARPRASKLADYRRDNRSRGCQVIRQLTLLVGAGLVVAAGAQPAAAAAGWSIQPVPLPEHAGDASLYGVSCTSDRDCFAVGVATVLPIGDEIPLIEHWDGTAWTIQATTTRLLAEWGGSLSAVSCSSSRACMAVGTFFGSADRPLVERWDGATWSMELPPDGSVQANQFNGVSCESSTDCIAVGYGPVPVAEWWNGHRWSPQNMRITEPAPTLELAGVSCPSHTACAVVGWDDIGLCSDPYYYNDFDVPVLGIWSSGRWSVRRRPDLACSTTGLGANDLNAVSCASATACTAVGTEINRWNGRGWTTQRAPIGTDVLTGVACASTSACTAVGHNIYTWNGHAWSNQATARPANATAAALNGVSCLSPASCVAAGDYETRGGEELPLIESER